MRILVYIAGWLFAIYKAFNIAWQADSPGGKAVLAIILIVIFLIVTTLVLDLLCWVKDWIAEKLDTGAY